MQKWEYNFIVFKLEPGMSAKEVNRLDQLNAAGADGWEMVNVMPLGQRFLVYTFKRPGVRRPKPRNGAPRLSIRAFQYRKTSPAPSTRFLRSPSRRPSRSPNLRPAST